MSNCTIIIHQGYGDIFNSIGLINYYSTIFNSVNVLVLDNTRIIMINEIFTHKSNIKCTIPIYLKLGQNDIPYHYYTCIICMQQYNESFCPRKGKTEKCKLIDYTKYDGDIIKIGSF